jgi:hypothetical protein
VRGNILCATILSACCNLGSGLQMSVKATDKSFGLGLDQLYLLVVMVVRASVASCHVVRQGEKHPRTMMKFRGML